VIRRLLLAVACLVVAWLVACTVLFVWPPGASTPSRADAVVVLAGARDSRLDPALALVRRGVAPVLVISSPGHDPKWRTAHRLCNAPRKAYAFRVICFEAHPYSTQGEARAITRLAQEHHWTHVAVVTSTFHVTRARMLIRRCFHGPLSMVGTTSTWWKLPDEWASESGKLLVQLTLRRGC
jgi:uncharacterized SAM-binding protein YcdF (DUF218 family)